MDDLDLAILAATRTKCHRPDCKVKHRAKPLDMIKQMRSLIDSETRAAMGNLAKPKQTKSHAPTAETLCDKCGQPVVNSTSTVVGSSDV